jgi:hypothetical protein
MRFINSFGRFWYDFIVGDDWTIALAVVAAIAVTWLLVHANVPAWWFLPIVVLLSLGASVWRVAQSSR